MNPLPAVTYGNGIIYSLGVWGSLTSADGTTWTLKNFRYYGHLVSRVTYGNGTFVAIGQIFLNLGA